MRKFLVLLSLVAMVAALSSLSFAAITLPVVLAADDNPTAGANSATAFNVNTTNGHLTLVAQLKTGGTGLGGGYFANTGTAITSNGSCVWVTNTGSDTITSFAAPSYAKTGDAGIPGMFSTNGAGGSIAVAPNGKFLVSGNSGTLNISLWNVGASCKLTHVADYTPSGGADFISPVGITPDNTGVVVPLPDFESVEFYSVGASGLTDVNNLAYASLSACAAGCFPTGMDFTNDSKVVVFGDATTGQNAVMTANIGAGGLSNAQVFSVNNSAGAMNPNVPWFSKNGAAGNGELYIGMSGFSTGIPSGEVTTMFTESPLNITVEGNGTLIPNSTNFQGAIRSIGATGSGSGGGGLLVAQDPNTIQAVGILSGGHLFLGPVTTDPNAAGLLSIEVYPNTR
jgi:hypothetical protein